MTRYTYNVYSDFAETGILRLIKTTHSASTAIDTPGAKYIVKTQKGENVSLCRFTPTADYPLTDNMTFALTKFRMPCGTIYWNWPEVSCVFRTGCVFASRVPEGHVILEPHEFASFDDAPRAPRVSPKKKTLVPAVAVAVPLDEDLIQPQPQPLLLPPDEDIILKTKHVEPDKHTECEEIKRLLNECEAVRGKRAKCEASKNTFDKLLSYRRLTAEHGNFRATVVQKMREIIGDPSFEIVWGSGLSESFRKLAQWILQAPTEYDGFAWSARLGNTVSKANGRLVQEYTRKLYEEFHVISRREFNPTATVFLRCSRNWLTDVPFTGQTLTIHVPATELPTFAFRFIVDGVPRCSVNYPKAFDTETGAATNNCLIAP